MVPDESVSRFADAFRQTAAWPVPNLAAGVVDRDRSIHTHGPADQPFALASVTKPLVAYAVLVSIEEGSLSLESPVSSAMGPLDGVTVRHLLAHASGVGPDEPTLVAAPGTRRIYSNAGFELLGDMLAAATGFSIADYLHEAVAVPLGMASTELRGSPAHAAVSTVSDLLRFARELLQPTLITEATLAAATSPQLPELDGVLPGFGRQQPNPWGLGFEIRGTKSPHWTAASNHPSTFGHFGRAGTMLWVDPVASMASVALTDRDFGPWAAEAWPPFSEAVLTANA